MRTRRSLPACPVVIKNSQQPVLSVAGGSPTNTDIPPQRVMHAKRASYPSGRSAGVYLQLGGYEDRHGEKCHLPSPLAVLTPLCCEVGAAGGVWEFLPPPPPRQPPPLPLPSPTAKRKDDLGVREPSKNASLSTRRVNQSQTLASFPKRGAGGGRGGGTGSSKRYLSLPPLLPPSLARSLPQLLHTNMLKLSRQDFTQQRWSWIV